MRYICLSFAVMVAVAMPCRADFVNGTDSFRGIGLDSNTWATDGANGGGSYLQNNGLEINASGSSLPAPFAIYYTWDAMVPVGGSVWATVDVLGDWPEGNAYVNVGLIDDPSSYFSSSPPESTLLGVEAIYANGGSMNGSEHQVLYDSGTGVGSRLSKVPPVFGSPMVYQVERLSSSLTRFSLFSERGTTADGQTRISLVASVSLGNFTQPADMHVWLEAYAAVVSFDSVTVNHPLPLSATTLPSLPEPGGTLAVAAAVGCLLRRRRRDFCSRG